jgi:hypothetical protein
MLKDSSYLQSQGKKSGLAQTLIDFQYPWDIRQLEGRVWYGFADTDLEVLAPQWEPEYTRGLLNKLAEGGVFDTQEGSNGIHYSFRS